MTQAVSHRKQQIESTLKRLVSRVLSRGLSDPRITGLVSVTQVDVAPDGHEATIYVSVLPEKDQSRTIHGLSHAAGYISSIVRKEVAMRTVPHLRFCLDESLKKQASVFEAIESGLAKELQQRTCRTEPGAAPEPNTRPGEGDPA